MNIDKIVGMIDELDIKITWINKGTHGTYDRETDEIQLNLESMIAEVFIHELMHFAHPLLNRESDEDIIDDLTVRIWKKLNTKQIREIAKKLLERR